MRGDSTADLGIVATEGVASEPTELEQEEIELTDGALRNGLVGSDTVSALVGDDLESRV